MKSFKNKSRGCGDITPPIYSPFPGSNLKEDDMKHTPGPWEVGKRESSYKANTKDPGEMKALETLGKVEFNALSIGGNSGNAQVAIIPLDESNEANARLIASAPELLGALKNLVSEAQYYQTSEQGWPRDGLVYAVGEAKEAIKKAEED